jgi:hypothetical protein
MIEETQSKANPKKRLTQAERLSRPPLEVRIAQLVADLKDQAERLPPGSEREALLRRARIMDISAHMNEWLSSPGLKAPD